jgi:hypothetical protein
MAGGPLLLGLGGVVVLAGTMGNVDGNVQACGAQIANDIVGAYLSLDHKRAVLSAKLGMLAITLLSAWLATRTISHLVTLAILSYQGIIQLAVPQYLGIFWKRGNAIGSILGTVVGFALAIFLQTIYPDGPAWAWGLTSGILALAVNAAVYVGCAVLLPHADAERRRVNDLFAFTNGQLASPITVESWLGGPRITSRISRAATTWTAIVLITRNWYSRRASVWRPKARRMPESIKIADRRIANTTPIEFRSKCSTLPRLAATRVLHLVYTSANWSLS